MAIYKSTLKEEKDWIESNKLVCSFSSPVKLRREWTVYSSEWNVFYVMTNWQKFFFSTNLIIESVNTIMAKQIHQNEWNKWM